MDVLIKAIGTYISIPKWYDWSEETKTGDDQGNDISIPKWYDWSDYLGFGLDSDFPFQFLNGTIGVRNY